MDRSRSRLILFLPLLILGLTVLAGCRKSGADEKSGDESERPALTVTASIRPYALLAKEIGGERISVDILMKENVSPHLYSPKMSDLRQLEKSDLFILNGMHLEGTLETILPSLKNTLSVADILRLSSAAPAEAETDECRHGRPNPHFWFSPEIMKRTAASLAEMLALLDNEGAGFYRRNAVRFAETTDRAVADAQTARSAYPETFSYLTMHDSYAYLNEVLGIKAVPVEIAPGHEPSAKAAAALLETVAADGIRFLVLDPQTEGRSARRIADSAGLKTTVIDPLGSGYDSFFDYYRKTWERLAEAYDSH